MSQKRLLRFPIGFVAGFISVLLFHQGVLALLNSIGFTPFAPYPMNLTQPFGIPQLWSFAFWGGVWGVVFSILAFQHQQNFRYWVTALLFGALAPTAVFLFVVLPLKGQPIAGGWQPELIATGLMVNSAWGVGTAIFLQWLSKRMGSAL
jgi:hypothetical protein